jgi:RNA polymerase sigma-70 factor (ECF subfamily)
VVASDEAESTLSDFARDAARVTDEVRTGIVDSAAAVRRFLFGMCGDWNQAEDMAQEALLKAWARRQSFGGRSNVRTWVFAIARNHWLDQLRRRRTKPCEETMNENTTATTDPPPYMQLRRGELAGAVAAALEKLPSEQREALALRESEGLTFNQVAQMLDIPVATAKSRVRYALLKLADELKPFQSEIGGS